MVFEEVTNWQNLWLAWRQACRGKSGRDSAAHFRFRVADKLLGLQSELVEGRYVPGPYRRFTLVEAKRREISAAPFRDRVVHHALCRVMEPFYEQRFIPDSYANRVGKGSHRAIDRFQQLARRHAYVLRLDIVKHFESMDHAVLMAFFEKDIRDPRLFALIEALLASHDDAATAPAVYFPGDDLLAACRPRGLPIGNQTSQFWSNCYLHPLDLFIKRQLGCRAYLRYVDDFALFADSKTELYKWKQEIVGFLQGLRLRIHEHSTQVAPTRYGTPWLGFVIYPDYRRLKARKAVHATRRLNARYRDWCAGKISFAEFDASVQGWIAHARHGNTRGLRERVLAPFDISAAFHEKN